MSAPITFEVIGDPAPQGSKRAVGRANGRAIMVESSTKVKPWRDSVAAAARDAAGLTPLDCPLSLDIVFRFSAPKARAKGGRKYTAPDLDKLLRSTCDAMQTAGLIKDDARICEVHASKIEVDSWTGAVIVLTVLPVVLDGAQ